MKSLQCKNSQVNDEIALKILKISFFKVLKESFLIDCNSVYMVIIFLHRNSKVSEPFVRMC
jgi:hypothetical protein